MFTPREEGVTLTDIITERLPGKLPPLQVRRVLLSSELRILMFPLTDLSDVLFISNAVAACVIDIVHLFYTRPNMASLQFFSVILLVFGFDFERVLSGRR